MSSQVSPDGHPSHEQLEGAAYGWLPAEQERVIRGHAAACARCGPLLAAEDAMRRRLLLLRHGEPRVDVARAVLRRIESGRYVHAGPVRPPQARPWRAGPWRRQALLGWAAALVVVVVGISLGTPTALQAATRWLQAVVVRQVPPPGQPGAPPARQGTPGSAGAPLRRVTLAEARAAAPFPVALPAEVPTGFVLAEVTVFQPQPAAPPTEVLVTYRRSGAYQPLVITYQSPAASGEVRAAPGAVQELLVDGHRALYIDAAVEGIQTASGAGAVAQLDRLIVERPDVVLIASGDRRDGLDAQALAAVLVSIP